MAVSGLPSHSAHAARTTIPTTTGRSFRQGLHPHRPVGGDPETGLRTRPSQARTAVIAVVATFAVIAASWFGWQKYYDHTGVEKKEQLSSWCPTP
jgi:hypothetical protein